MSSSERKRVVIIGSSFAGLTAAFELTKKVGDRHEIVVLDPRPDFTFIPSLIWLPFGGREAKDVTFPLAPRVRPQGDPVHQRGGREDRPGCAHGDDELRRGARV